MQHNGTGSTGQELAQSPASFSLLGWERATLSLGRFHGHCWALQHMLGSSSSHLACWGRGSLPLGHCRLLLGAEHRGGLFCHKQKYPGVARCSTWVPTAWASGCTGEPVLPSEWFSHQQHKLPASRWLGSRDTPVYQQVMPSNRLPGKGPAPDWPSTSPEQAL